MNELSTLTKFHLICQQTSLFDFTGTWLSEDVEVQLDGFSIIHGNTTHKNTEVDWGGLCMAVKSEWATTSQ